MYTDEQKLYIEFRDKINTKLIACAGSGKTKCIIDKILFIANNNIYKSDEILVLTFSKFTQQDFVRRLDRIDDDYIINRDNIRTIDSFAKLIIDKTNTVDVNLLSYKFQKYLQNSSTEQLQLDKDLSKFKILFVDEAQDLNLIQSNIISELNKKLDIKINLIGDPNQNIYQFRKSSDKYLREFEAKTFYLTKNFRSASSIVEFSKYLRPTQTNIYSMKEDNTVKPIIFFTETDQDFENQIMTIINNAQEENIDLKDIAIIAPTRGKMKSWGMSYGLCFVTNILYKHSIKFKQFYEESVDESSTRIEYKPESNHINILTFMGSKGLEWKYVLILNADVCLINYANFDKNKHDNDRYLLYVACSRAIDNMYIFCKYKQTMSGPIFKINPWFKEVPTDLYLIGNEFENISYPQIKFNPIEIKRDNNITKIIDTFDEETLDKLAQLINYESIEKELIKMYRYKQPELPVSSSIFLGKYVEAYFHAIYSIKNIMPKKRYLQIESIIKSEYILTNVKKSIVEWFELNKTLTWAEFNVKKSNIDKDIVSYIETRFNKSIAFSSHLIVPDSYFAKFIMKKKDWINKIYSKYLEETDIEKIKLQIFYLIVILHSIESHHYFHVKNKGGRFTDILDIHANLFNKMTLFINKLNETYIANNVYISNYGLIGEIDLINIDDEYIEIKCVSHINLKHILQLLMYNLMRSNINNETNYKLIFMNFLKGEKVIYKVNSYKFQEVIEIFSKYPLTGLENDKKR